jgi:tetratricopeptide (TPR) repeat protein
MQTTRLNKLLEFLKADPADPFILYALATEYNTAGDYEQAFHYYNLLVDNSPEYVGTYYHLGKLLEKTGDKDRAVEIYRLGLNAARNKHDNHAYAELQGALNAAMGMDYEDD